MNGEVKACTVFVFWPYDLFPYVVGGPAYGSDTKLGCWFVPSYQMNIPFNKVVGVYPVEVGRGIKKELEELDQRLRKAKKELEAQYVAKAREYLPGIKP